MALWPPVTHLDYSTCALDLEQMSFASVIPHSMTEVIMLAVPMLMLATLQLRPKQIVMLCGIFGLGVLYVLHPFAPVCR